MARGCDFIVWYQMIKFVITNDVIMEIRNLKDVDFDTLFQAFDDAFSDYEVHFEKSEVQSMLKRRGYNPELSFAAFHNGRIVAFTLNGVGWHEGVLTAYDTGTGTLREFRGKGIAGEIFTASIPYLKEAGVKRYLLEVLQDNNKAISVYKKLGFRITREFLCFRQAKSLVDVNAPETIPGYRFAPLDSASILTAGAMRDFIPSWQNSVDSIVRAGDDLICSGVFFKDELVGYCVSDPLTGDLTQIAVARDHRRKGLATKLLSDAVRNSESDIVKVLNISDNNLGSMVPFLSNKNIKLASKQFEMLLDL